jgi:hypothetical protein
MNKHFDLAGKAVGTRALKPSGSIIANAEISGRTQYADLVYEPDPGRQLQRDNLGLLGRLASNHCLIEIYAHAPSPNEFRACLVKHFTYWQQYGGEPSSSKKPDDQSDISLSKPVLWIITSRLAAPILAKLKPDPDAAWPNGTYFWGGEVLRVGFVVANELPRERSTLLVRLMTTGPDTYANLSELRRLPVDSIERAIAEQPLLELNDRLSKKPSRTPEEEEFVVAMQRTWEDARIDGQTEGEAIGQAIALLTVLESRGIAASESARDRILAQTELSTLQRWLKNALVATSIDGVFISD